MKINDPIVERGAIALADLENIDGESTPNEFWDTICEYHKDILRKQVAAVLEGIGHEELSEKLGDTTNSINIHDICYQDQNGDWVVPEPYALSQEYKINRLINKIIEWNNNGLINIDHLTLLEELAWWPE